MNKANLLIVSLFISLILDAQQHIFLPDNKPDGFGANLAVEEGKQSYWMAKDR